MIILILQIHPSSALKYNDVTPEFIVYECLVHASKDYMLNVCAADSSWLCEIDQNVLEEERKVRYISFFNEYIFFHEIKTNEIEKKLYYFLYFHFFIHSDLFFFNCVKK